MNKSLSILLDTHIALWAITDDPRLPGAVRSMILSEENQIIISTASVWEVSIKHNLHPDHMPVSGKAFAGFCLQAGYTALAIENRHIFTLETLSRSEKAPKHKDPFDRILIAQAKSDHLLFITHDKLLPDYNESCILFV